MSRAPADREAQRLEAFPLGRMALVLGLGGLVTGSACGAAASQGGGDTDLPTRGAGPFGLLEPDPVTLVEEPVLLADPDEEEHWRAPSLRAEEDGTLTVYFAAVRAAGVEIRRAQGVTLTDGPSEIGTVLEALSSWEATRVDHPGLVVPGVEHAVGLFYEGGGGAIGYAGAADGATFERRPDPVLQGDGSEEGLHLGEPAAVWFQGDLWLYYAAKDRAAIFAARFPSGDLSSPERLDADDRTPTRDPVLGPNPFALQFDVGGVGAPHARVTSLAGRPVLDLWYTGWDDEGRRTAGFAGSHDGFLFKRFDDNPVLPAGDAQVTDPCVVTNDIGALMLFTLSSGSGPEVIAGALH